MKEIKNIIWEEEKGPIYTLIGVIIALVLIGICMYFVFKTSWHEIIQAIIINIFIFFFGGLACIWGIWVNRGEDW